jgi:protein AFG1
MPCTSLLPAPTSTPAHRQTDREQLYKKAVLLLLLLTRSCIRSVLSSKEIPFFWSLGPPQCEACTFIRSGSARALMDPLRVGTFPRSLAVIMTATASKHVKITKRRVHVHEFMLDVHHESLSTKRSTHEMMRYHHCAAIGTGSPTPLFR